VKYSHHPTGRANISQTGRIQTISKEAVPLRNVRGPLFVLRLQGLAAFQKLGVKDTEDRSVLFAGFSDDIQAFQVVGSLLRRSDVLARSNVDVLGPVVNSLDTSGNLRTEILLGPPTDYPLHELVMTMRVLPARPVGRIEDPFLLMLAGFDSPLSLHTPEAESSFLALAYPVRNPSVLSQIVRSIDLAPGSDTAALASSCGPSG
jgi:hypothetical protein